MQCCDAIGTPSMRRAERSGAPSSGQRPPPPRTYRRGPRNLLADGLLACLRMPAPSRMRFADLDSAACYLPAVVCFNHVSVMMFLTEALTLDPKYHNPCP